MLKPNEEFVVATVQFLVKKNGNSLRGIRYELSDEFNENEYVFLIQKLEDTSISLVLTDDGEYSENSNV